MLTLVTGTPGSGKTLLTIAEIKARAEKEKRDVYYSGIDSLKLGWIELDDATKWYTVPVGSIIVIDEAQRFFRPRHYSAGVPEYVSRLETHRHEGIDVYLITQNPSLVDKNCRVLAGRHVHYVRQFGTQLAKRYEWGEYKDDVQARSDAEMTLVKYPTDVFKLYKSAEVHTHKARLPGSVIKALVVIVLLPVAIWFGWHTLSNMREGKSAGYGLFGSDAKASTGGGGFVGQVSQAVHSFNANEYVRSFQPRIAGLEYTAPVYDKLMTPKQAPTPSGCVASASRCACYTEQGTPIESPVGFCSGVVAHGVFHFWAAPASDRETMGRTGSAGAPPILPGPAQRSASVVTAMVPPPDPPAKADSMNWIMR